jgi:acetylornithine aminotransferase
LSVLETLEKDSLYQRATAIGDIIMQGLASELEGATHVKEIRGRGCMIGIELTKPCKSLYAKALEQGLIINVTADSVVRLLPPLIMSDDEAKQVVTILAPLIKDFQ